MFAQCKGPVWHRDDFSYCFQNDYLQTLLPLIACAVSIAIIAIRIASRKAREHSVTKRAQTSLVDIDGQEEDVQNTNGSAADLTLQKTISRTHSSAVEQNKPKGKITLVVVEFAAVLAELALSVVFLLRHDEQTRSRTGRASVASIVVWGYLAVLVGLRLFLSASTWRPSIGRLWSHTAILYGIQWLVQTIVFRSVIIHPHTRFFRSLAIVNFALTSLLGLIVLVSRKGNRAVSLEYEGNIEPSREPLASILSEVTFSWVDPIVWKGYKKPLELTDVWNVSIQDKAELVLDQFRQIKKTHMLAIRLLLFFKKDLLVQGAYCTVSSIFMFLPTLLLKQILQYVEEPEQKSVQAAWLWVILLFVTGVVQAIGDGQSLWLGRKICIRIRGVIIGEIYSKVLRRKAAATTEAELGEEKPAEKSTLWSRIKSWGKKNHKASNEENSTRKPADAQVSNGTIINLMSIDSFKLSEICAYLHFLWAATPVQLIMAVALLYNVLGFSSFAGIALMVMVMPLNLWIAKSFQSAQKKIMTATDSRIHSTNEVLQNIRIIKYFAWEQRFEANVNEKRRKELSALWAKYVLWASAATVWSAIPILITFASFLLFTLVEKRRLVPSVAFPALSMFSLLRIPLDQLADMVAHVQESKVSVDRIEEFLVEEETEKYHQLKLSKQASPHETRIALQNATLTYGTREDATSSTGPESFRLINMNVEFEVGKLNVIAGATGSGKTSLLMALLGEMKLVDGQVLIPGGYSRQDLRPEVGTGLTESVAYCAQQAWLVNATIKENILFASAYDSSRYKNVISACALTRDLEILDAGDQTLVGEKGITLSGGQKQRISLARALYSNSRHLLLDDCLSAVDSHTAKHIFEQALTGSMMFNRTCILVSHNIGLTVPHASLVVVLENGKIKAQGPPSELTENGALGDELLKSAIASARASAVPSRVPSPARSIAEDENVRPATNDLGEASQSTPDFVDTRTETKATGSVKLYTIKMYLRSMGPWYYWLFAAVGFAAVQIGSVATNLWIREWANAYSSHTQRTTDYGLYRLPNTRAHAMSGGLVMQFPQSHINSTAGLSRSEDEEVNAAYYLGVYALIGGAYILICFTREITLFWGSLRASWTIHERLLHSIMRATFRFFDSTPLGQLTNRFSKDIQSIDQEVAPVAIGLLHCSAAVLTIVILISSITPAFLIPGFFIAAMYVATGLFYIRSSRDLKRIESVQRSPLFQHFGETLSGVVTIRAYGDEARFVEDSNRRVNTHNRPFIYLWATNRWLAFRIDVAGATVSFFSATFILLNVGRIDAGAAGLSLSYAITFTQNVLWLVRLYAANEQNMNSVERVQEYVDVDQEAAAQRPENKPAGTWPSNGAVQFVDYSTRYRKDLDFVLRHLTFKIQAGEKVGIVGRTGAGKSSLALALFRGLEAEEGKIIIDDVEIGEIGLQDLREAITIVPQDPTLFSGTLRSNLDPFDLFADEEIFTALRRVQLISGNYDGGDGSGSTSPPSDTPTIPNGSAHRANSRVDSTSETVSSGDTLVKHVSNARDGNKNIFHNLSSQIAESGSNLSQGQRQLLCLARALLKSPKVLIMDEATASIDYATDSKIQDTLRELKNNTIITIAHRLQTIIDYDKVLVLDKGEVIEFADPYELIRKEGGLFRGMCETNGDLEHLTQLAKKAWEERRLVDDE